MRAWIDRIGGQLANPNMPSYFRAEAAPQVKGIVHITWTAESPLTSADIQIVGARDTPVVMMAAIPWGSGFDWDSRAVPDGHYVVPLVTNPPSEALHAVMIVNNSEKPLTGPQWIPADAADMKRNWGPNTQGWEWVQYPGSPPATQGIAGGSRAVQPYATRVPHSGLWQECMTLTGPEWGLESTRFVELPDGTVTIMRRQQYTQGDNETTINGTNVDGPYGVARAGPAISGFEDARGLVVTCANGWLYRCTFDRRVETLFGPRLKAGALVPRVPPGGMAPAGWRDNHYEHVGTIAEGSPTLDRPGQSCADPRDPNVLWVADTKNNRIVTIDTRTGIGHHVCGALDGREGWLDGKGAAALLKDPRGIGAIDSDTFLIAEDHGSALKILSRDGTITTAYRPKRGDNFDLVTTYNGITTDYVHRIRAGGPDKAGGIDPSRAMSYGPFDTANLMHFQQVAKDVKPGCWLIPLHHPHVVVRADLINRTFELVWTIFDSGLQFDIGYLPEAWISISSDPLGTNGPPGDFIISYWAQGSTYRRDMDGKGPVIAGQTYAWFTGPGPNKSAVMDSGPLERCFNPGYPTMAVFGASGRIWHAGTSGEGLYAISKALPTDPVWDEPKWTIGKGAYENGDPAPQFRHGYRVMSCLGEPSGYNFATEADCRAWCATWPQAASLTAAELDALAYYVWWETAANGLTGAAPVVNVPPPVVVPPVPPALTLVERVAALEVQARSRGWAV